MRNGLLYTLCVVFLSLLFCFNSSFSKGTTEEKLIDKAQIEKISFYQKNEVNYLEIKLDRDIDDVRKFHVKQDKQIVLDLKNVMGTKKILRAMDTSEFSGSTTLISPYIKKDKKDVRIIIQLRDNVRSILKRKEKRIILAIENFFGVFTAAQLARGDILESTNEIDRGKGPKGSILSNVHAPKSNRIEDILENITLSGPKKYVGNKVSFDVNDLAVTDLLKMIAEATGFNIILDDDVKKAPPLTLTLTSIPWDQALDTVFTLSNLVAKKNGNILMVTTLDKATAELERESKAEEMRRKAEPLLTKIFLISFAKLDPLQKILEGYTTKERGEITKDERTHSLIIKDTATNLDRIEKIVKTLDTQTAQVLIESRIVEVVEGYQKEIGFKKGFSFGYDPVKKLPTTSSGDNPAGTWPGVGPGFAFSTAPSTSRSFMGLEIETFGRFLNLDFSLQLMEMESKARIISSPKLITQNKKKAVINSTETTSYLAPSSSSSDSSSDTPATFEKISIKLTLEVTPQVTNDGSIDLAIKLDNGGLGNPPEVGYPPDTTERSIETNVLVDNGSTVMLGGIFVSSKQESHSGIPYLKDLPLVGWLFRTFYNPKSERSELVIFITPRIINQEEAGLVDREDEING